MTLLLLALHGKQPLSLGSGVKDLNARFHNPVQTERIGV